MKQIGHSYKQHHVADSYDAIVIGSGLGGLTTAAMLAKFAGQRVLVLERHYTAGGFTHVFHRPGYEWDVGVHYVGQVNNPTDQVRCAFDHVTEGRLRWNPMPDVYDRVFIEDRSYDFPTGTERFRAQMKSYFPEEGAAIDKYIASVFSTTRAGMTFFAEKAVPGPIARLIGPAMRSRFLRYASQTTAEVLRQFTQNPELIAVLTAQWGDYGLPPSRSSFGIHALVAQHYLEGASYPVGGASEIASCIAPVIERAGGEIIVSAEVSQIVLGPHGEALGVRMADGRELRARTIISDAGAHNTFARLLPADLPSTATARRDVESLAPSMSHLCLYVGLRRAENEPEFDATNLWIHKAADHDAAFERCMNDPEAPLPVSFISFPSAKDPTFERRYPGHSTIEVVAPAPYAWFEKWANNRWKRRGADYDDLKRDLTARLLADLEQHVPATKGRVEYTELSTPLSTRHFANFQHGEIYGLSAVPERFRLRSIGARTPVRNLYLTGADAVSPGLAGALFGGIVTASAVLGRNLRAKVTKPAPPKTYPRERISSTIPVVE